MNAVGGGMVCSDATASKQSHTKYNNNNAPKNVFNMAVN